MASNIIMWNDIDMNEITFGAPKSLDNGGKIVGLYHKKKNLIFQTPAMIAPYGMNVWTSDNGVSKYSVDLSINNDEFLNMLKQLEEKIINGGLANSTAWFKKKYNTWDVVEALYTRVIKYSKDAETGEINNKYPPVVKLQLPYRNGKFECEAFANKDQTVNIETSLTKRSSITAIVQCGNVWLAGGKFGCTLKVLQMKIVSGGQKAITGYSFIPDPESEAATTDENDNEEV